MGTFDSIYHQKIRKLEEENEQLRKLIREGWWPFGKSDEQKSIEAKRVERFTPRTNSDFRWGGHNEEIHTALMAAEEHYGPKGLKDTAIPFLMRAQELIEAGHGSWNQHDHLTHMVAQLDTDSLPADSPLHRPRGERDFPGPYGPVRDAAAPPDWGSRPSVSQAWLVHGRMPDGRGGWLR